MGFLDHAGSNKEVWPLLKFNSSNRASLLKWVLSRSQKPLLSQKLSRIDYHVTILFSEEHIKRRFDGDEDAKFRPFHTLSKA